jgi:hypothetical protein
MVFFKVRSQEILVMPTDQLRNRTVGSKMTESEYEQLAAVAEREGLTLGEWCRSVLLARANTNEGKKANATDQTLFAEVMALRTILLNALFKLAQGAVLTTEELDRLIERADGERFDRVRERLAEVVTGGRS